MCMEMKDQCFPHISNSKKSKRLVFKNSIIINRYTATYVCYFTIQNIQYSTVKIYFKKLNILVLIQPVYHT